MKKLFVLVALLAATPAVAQDKPDVAHGKALYNSVGCSQCHGWAAQGGLAGPVLFLPSSSANFIAQLRRPKAVMPPYTAKVLADKDIDDIYAYVQTMPKAPDVKTIKLLQD